MKSGSICSLVVFSLTISVLTGCSSRSDVVKAPPPQAQLVEYRVQDVPGAVEYVWEEPMTDVVDVPPGLDPEGHYYRPGHQEVVEVRQGRWQYYKRPEQ